MPSAYFPFSGEQYNTAMGTQALGIAPVIEFDPAHYHSELRLKEQLLGQNHAYYFAGQPDTLAMQWEAVATLLPDMARCFPEQFGLERHGERWRWHNMALGTTCDVRLGDAASLPHAPLDWLGRQVQEDLLILAGDPARGTPLVAGQLCFPTGWCLEDKLGSSFLDIHIPVPKFNEQTGRSANLLMERLKPGRPVWRLNWGVKANDALDQSPPRNAALEPLTALVTADNAGERCWMRVERQVLVRLPRTNAVLFTIHVYQTPIGVLAANPVYARRMLGVLQSVPEDMLRYKGMRVFAAPLVAYLETAIAQQDQASG